MAKIKSIEYFRVKPRWLFVKVTDDQGRFGWGEGTLEGHTQAVEGALDEVIVRLVGLEAEYVPSNPSLPVFLNCPKAFLSVSTRMQRLTFQ